MSFILPPTIALKSVWFNTFCTYTDHNQPETNGYVKISGENVFSPLVKFEVVTASTGKGVHLRCCHNKKFLRLKIEGRDRISPEADEPDENPASWTCTLFEPQEAEDGKPYVAAHFFHVHTQKYIYAYDAGNKNRLLVTWDGGDKPFHQTPFYIIDLESLVILPKYVAFKATNRKYLKAEATNSHPTFTSDDKGDPESWFEVTTLGSGMVQIKSSSRNQYLGYNSDNNWIVADFPNDDTANTLFWPVKVDATTVAFRSTTNNQFCILVAGTRNTIYDGLSASHTSISKYTRFTLDELVLSRKIYNTDFDLANAIVYGETPITMATTNVTNNSSKEDTVQLKFSYTESMTSTWTTSRSWMVGMEVSVSFKIPFIGDTDVTASAQYSGSYGWGGEVKTENQLEATYTAVVPPNTSISVSLMATKGNCDVPYSYYQKDVLYNGNTVVYKKNDGLYTGVNSYKYHYNVTTLIEPTPEIKMYHNKVMTSLTLREPTPKTLMPNREQKLPDPLVDPTVEVKVPMPGRHESLA